MKEMGLMRTRTGWLGLLLTAGLALAPTTARAQVMTGPDVPPSDSPWPFPLYHSHPETGGFYTASDFWLLRQTNPLKSQVIAIRGFNDVDGSIQASIQAVNGGTTSIIPGKFFGDASPALDTEQVSGPGTYQAGFGLTLGWRFGEGSPIEAVELRWRHLAESKYSAVASFIPANFQLGNNLENSFLFSPVFNFPNEFAGPASKVGVSVPNPSNGSSAALVLGVNGQVTIQSVANVNQNGQITSVSSVLNVGTGGSITANVVATSQGVSIFPQSAFGIWNAASVMTLEFIQRYDDFDIIGRIPIYQGETCRCYGLVGGRAVIMWERFTWRTQDVEAVFPSTQATASVGTLNIGGPPTIIGPGTTLFQPGTAIQAQNISVSAGAPPGVAPGNSAPQDVANYSNVVSNRLYGPLVGIGSEYYIGHGFSVSLDTRIAGLLDVVKEEAKYELGDRSTAHKHARTDYTLAPEVGATAYMTWYPIEGIELRVGYDFSVLFNSVSSPRPVDFNFSSVIPDYYKHQTRTLDGWQAGLAFIF
jgi:hypothetical protein